MLYFRSVRFLRNGMKLNIYIYKSYGVELGKTLAQGTLTSVDEKKLWMFNNQSKKTFPAIRKHCLIKA